MVSLPSILESIVESAAGAAAGIHVAGRADVDSMSAVISREQPDVVLMGLQPGADVVDFADVLYARPGMRLFGINAEGRELHVCRLTPQVTRVGNVSPSQLIDAIRDGEEGGG